MIFAGVCSAIAIIFLPETYAPTILENKVRCYRCKTEHQFGLPPCKAKRLRRADPAANKNLYAESERQDRSVKALVDRTIKRPFKMLAVEPILILVTVYLSVVYGVLYARMSCLFSLVYYGY